MHLDCDKSFQPRDVRSGFVDWRSDYLHNIIPDGIQNQLTHRVQVQLAHNIRPVRLRCLNAEPERNRYLPGLRAWVGFKQVAVPFDRPDRAAGDPRMSLSRLFKLALDGIFGFSY